MARFSAARGGFVNNRPTDKPVPDAVARVMLRATDWRKTQKDLIAADGTQAIPASAAHRRAGRKLAEAVDLAERKAVKL